MTATAQENAMVLEETTFHSVRRAKVSEQIAQQLLDAIIKGRYKVGEQLPPERELAEQFNASRVAVREAISALTAKGLATSIQGRGTVVNPHQQWNSLDPQIFMLENNIEALFQLLEFRKIVEPDIAALAAERITGESLDRLRHIISGHSVDTVEQHILDDVDFHLELARASGNRVLLIIMNSINDLLQESRHLTYYIPGAPDRAWDRHAEILQAFEARDPQAARQAMIEHLKDVESDLVASKVRILQKDAERER
jgi:GntR family transcriptional repressor for pyruvate dehydrogenase complex